MELKVNASPSEFDIYYESPRPKEKRTTDIRSYFATSADVQTAEQGAEQNDGEVAGASGLQDVMQNHFSMFDSMMSNMRKGMEDFDVSPNADGHSFKSSSVMSYSKVGDEPPKMFQATTSTRCAPGGIKETRKAVKDSDSGLQKMKIGHQIKDRQHVVEKRHNMQTGEEEMKQDFMNMDESEAASFNNEWQQKVSGLLSPDPMPGPMPGPMQPQLEGPEQPRRGHRKRKAGRKGSGNANEDEN